MMSILKNGLERGRFSFVFIYTRLFFLSSFIAFLLSVHPEYFIFADFYNQKRLLQLAVILAALPLFFTSQFLFLVVFFAKKYSFVLCLLGICFVLGFLSSLSSQYPRIAVHEWLHFLSLGVLILGVIAAITLDSRGAKLLLLFSLASVALYLFKFIFIYFVAYLSDLPLSATVILSGAVNRNFIAQYMALFVPLVVGLTVLKWDLRSSATLFFLIVFCFLMLVADVRGGIVSLSFVTLISFFVLENRRKYITVFLFSMSIAAVAFIFVTFSRDTGGQLTSAPFTSSGRDFHWLSSFNIWLDNPFIGAGPAAYSYLIDTQIAHPHNFYLQMLSEWGAACVGILVILFFMAIKKVKEQYKQWSVFQVSVFLCLIQGMLHAGVSGVLVMPVSQLVFCFFLAAYVKAIIDIDGYSAFVSMEPRPKRVWLAVSIICASVVIGFLIVVYLNSPYLPESDTCIVKFGPRFWVDGGVIPVESCN